MDKSKTLIIVESWVSALPPNTVVVDRRNTSIYEYDEVIKVEPVRSGGSKIAFGIHRGGSFDVSVGKRMSFYELECSESLIIELCEAAKEGNIDETVYECRGKVIRSKGVLRLASDSYRASRTNLFPYIFCRLLFLGTTARYNYQKWI